MKILVVDDDVRVREVIGKMLSRFGYECRTASNGREALSILEEEHFPIVLSDIRMPVMDGIELLKEIKSKYPDVDVISITAHGKDHTFTDVVNAGATDFILKPFSKEELEAKLSRLVRERRLKSDIANSRNKLMSIFDGIKDGIYNIDQEFKIVSANKAFADILDLSIRDIIGKHCYELIYKNNVPCEGDDYDCPAKKCFATGVQNTTIHKRLKKNDKECYMEITATPLTGNDKKTTQIILVSKDITEGKKMEESLRKKIDELSALNYIARELSTSTNLTLALRNVFRRILDVLAVDLDCGAILLLNKEGDKLVAKGPIGLTDILKEDTEVALDVDVSGEVTISKKPVVVEDTEKYDMPNAKLLKKEGVKDFVSVPIVSRDRVHGAINVGSHVDHRFTLEEINLITLIANQIGLAIDNAKMYEETKNALEELKQTQSYLLQSEKMASVGQLAAGVAHEINNPTGFVHSNLGSLNKYSMRVLELIKKYEEGMDALKNNGHKDIIPFCEEIEELKKKLKIDFIMKDFQKVITDSLEGTERIKKIVADLKSFSHVDQVEFKQADINEGIESTLNVVWNELKYKCTVEKDYGDLPKIYCNLGQLNQVFANLLVNAGQAIEEKGVIRIATRYANGKSADNNEEQGHVEVKISDTGSGIPEDKVKRIFEPFFTTKEVGKGTGLGLSIAYDIIKKKHNGEIEVESEVGKGTTFTITLPITND